MMAKELDQEGDFKNAALEAELAMTLPELSTAMPRFIFSWLNSIGS